MDSKSHKTKVFGYSSNDSNSFEEVEISFPAKSLANKPYGDMSKPIEMEGFTLPYKQQVKKETTTFKVKKKEKLTSIPEIDETFVNVMPPMGYF